MFTTLNVSVPQAREADELTPAERTAATKAARAARASARAAARAQTPHRSPDFAHLDLAGLRELRRALMDEEDRVSYWRRILQARLDTVRAGDTMRIADSDNLAPVLARERMTTGRTALVRVMPADDVPPLPDLARLWSITPDPRDPIATAHLTSQLEGAEAELSEYRQVLHGKLGAATFELIARYHEDPLQCLVALPL